MQEPEGASEPPAAPALLGYAPQGPGADPLTEAAAGFGDAAGFGAEDDDMQPGAWPRARSSGPLEGCTMLLLRSQAKRLIFQP